MRDDRELFRPHNSEGVFAMLDARVLRDAANVLQRRTKKPKSYLLGVIVRLLRNIADDLDKKGKPA